MNGVHLKMQKKRRRDAKNQEAASNKKLKIEEPSGSQEPSPSITPADTPIASPSAKETKASNKAKNNARVVKERFKTIINKLIRKKWKAGKQMFNPFTYKITRENCVASGIPDYFNEIEEAMDLMTIKEKMNNLLYVSAELLARDVRLLVKNAQTYNRPNDPVYKQSAWISEQFEKFYETQLKKLNEERLARKEQKRLKKLEGKKVGNVK